MGTCQAPTPQAAEPQPAPELFYESQNAIGKETILFIHGACGSSQEWENVIPDLVLKGYHVLLPDLPAHGRSITIRPFTVEYAADRVITLIETQAKSGRAHVVGLSLGAHIAACVAERAKPGQIVSVIASGYNTIPRSRLFTSLIIPPIYMLHYLVNFAASPRVELAQWKNGDAGYGLMTAIVKAIFEPGAIGDIRARVLVVCAASPKTWLARDRVESSRELFACVVGEEGSGSRVVLHRSVRHAWHMEEPDLFAEMVLAWVRGEKLDVAFEDVR